MTRTVDVVAPHGLGLISTDEWDSVCTRQHNVLLEGPDDCMQVVLRLLERHLRTPVLRQRSQTFVDVSPTDCGALVLQDVTALGRRGQAGLLEWLEDTSQRRQVVSTTAYPLFPLVARGLFDEALYYRLNVMRLCFARDVTGMSVFE